MDLAILAQQATDIIVPALPFIYAGGKTVADKGKDMLIEGGKVAVEKSKDMLLEKGIEKLGSEGGKRAKALLEKISPKMSESLEKELIRASKNSEDPKAKEELQQEILKLLVENPDIAREIEIIVNINLKIDLVKQLVFGDNNLILNLEGVQGEELIKVLKYMEWKRQEELIQEVQRSYSPSALPNYSKNLTKFVTENRAEELSHALNHLQENKILLFSGIAGVGKTTLARVLIDFRPTGVPEPFWFDFHHNRDANLEDVLEALAAYLEAPEILSFKGKRQAGKPDINRLTEELRKRNSLWLVFDDLSYMINEKRNFIDPGLGLLFTSLRDNTHRAKVILTSRIMPLLDNGEYLIDELEDENRQEIKGLKIDFAVNYLKENGLDKIKLDILESLVESVEGHPFSLKLLVGLTKKHTPENILKDLNLYKKHQEDRIKKARFLFDKLVNEEKGLLERIAVYRQPEPPEAIKIMFTDNTPIDSVDTLLDKSLLETDNSGKYWLHPLVQEFAYDDLEKKNEAHAVACKYYLSIPLPEYPKTKEELQSAIEAHHHACEAGIYDLAAQIILYSKLHVYFDIWGDYTALITLYRRLLPADPLKEKVLLSNEMKAFVFDDLGIRYQQLGFVGKAIEYHEQALKIAREIGDRCGEGYALGNLGIAYKDLGEPRKAIEYYEQALKITREIGDRRGEGNYLGNLGVAYYSLGELRKSIEYYKQALKIAREIGDRRGEGNHHGNLGVAYYILGEPRKAIEYHEQALKIAREIGDRCGEGNHLGNLGLVYYSLGELRKAIEYYEQALKIAKDIGDRRGEGNHLGNLGSAYSDLGEPRKAIEFLKQSLEIGKAIEDPRIISGCERNLKELEGSND